MDKAEEVGVEAGCIEGVKPAEVVMTVVACNEAPPARRLTPLPKEEVEGVLSWKRRGHRGVRGPERRLRRVPGLDAH